MKYIYLSILFFSILYSNCFAQEIANREIELNNYMISTSISKKDSQNTLEIIVENINKDCMLGVSLEPIIEGGMASSKPILTNKDLLEVSGALVLKRCTLSESILTMEYPPEILAHILANFKDFPRDIEGWSFQIYIVNGILARPISGYRHIGEMQEYKVTDIPQGLTLLSSEAAEEEHAVLKSLNLITIPNSGAGAFIYINKENMLSSLKEIKFNVDLTEEKQ